MLTLPSFIYNELISSNARINIEDLTWNLEPSDMKLLDQSSDQISCMLLGLVLLAEESDYLTDEVRSYLTDWVDNHFIFADDTADVPVIKSVTRSEFYILETSLKKIDIKIGLPDKETAKGIFSSMPSFYYGLVFSVLPSLPPKKKMNAAEKDCYIFYSSLLNTVQLETPFVILGKTDLQNQIEKIKTVITSGPKETHPYIPTRDEIRHFTDCANFQTGYPYLLYVLYYPRIVISDDEAERLSLIRNIILNNMSMKSANDWIGYYLP